MLKYADILRLLRPLVIDRSFVRPVGDGAAAEAGLDLIMETVSVLEYDTDYLPGAELSGVFNDSRQVIADSVFAAIPGARCNGEDFAATAMQKGAKVVISERNLQSIMLPGTVNLVVKSAYTAYALLCNLQYDYPARTMTGFAVTGTNGKTTTAMLLRKLLNAAGKSCGLISTVEYDMGCGNIESADRTTPEAGKLFATFNTMRSNKLSCYAMEVSSHALAQDRIADLSYQAVIFTNLTGDHLDYHHTMEEYFRVKTLLFTQHLAADGQAIINCDDPWGKKLHQKIAPEKSVTFGINQGNWRIVNIKSCRNGSSFELHNGSACYQLQTNLAGLYNIYNITGALLALHTTGTLDLADSVRLLAENPLSVPGRLEGFELRNGATAFVDYAHTPDALSNVLTTLRKLAPNRLYCVFGCGGDRDSTKRPEMGRIAAELADEITITSDNPRSESPEAIINEIASGITNDSSRVNIEPDRRAAIIRTVEKAKTGDIILIAGKGHENYQEIAGVKHPFDDRQVVSKFLK